MFSIVAIVTHQSVPWDRYYLVSMVSKLKKVFLKTLMCLLPNESVLDS